MCFGAVVRPAMGWQMCFSGFLGCTLLDFAWSGPLAHRGPEGDGILCWRWGSRSTPVARMPGESSSTDAQLYAGDGLLALHNNVGCAASTSSTFLSSCLHSFLAVICLSLTWPRSSPSPLVVACGLRLMVGGSFASEARSLF